MAKQLEAPMEIECPHCECHSLVARRAIDSMLFTLVLVIRCLSCPFTAQTRAEDLMDVKVLWGPTVVRKIFEDLYDEWLERRIRSMHPLQALGDMA